MACRINGKLLMAHEIWLSLSVNDLRAGICTMHNTGGIYSARKMNLWKYNTYANLYSSSYSKNPCFVAVNYTKLI